MKMSKESALLISIFIGISLFLLIRPIFLPFASQYNKEIIGAADNAWWSKTLVAGTLGMLGVSFILMFVNAHIILPLLLSFLIYKWLIHKSVGIRV